MFLKLCFHCFRWSSSVKSWVHSLRDEEEGESMGDHDTLCSSVRPETGVKLRLRQIQTRTRSVLNICDKLQRYDNTEV